MAVWDAVVVGGGPAGSSAAFRLARSGVKVLLFEKHRMPRDKVCGGGLTRGALSSLDFPLPGRLVNRYCHGARVFMNGRTVEVRDKEIVAALVSRSVFDSFLLEQARNSGAAVIFDTVKDLCVLDDRVEIGTGDRKHYARVAVIASGASSALIRRVRAGDRDHERGVSIKQDLPCIDTDPLAHLGDCVNVYFNVGRYAYAWVFHHGAYCSISVGGRLDTFKDPRGAMKRFWKELGLPEGMLRPRGCIIPFGGYRRKVVSDRLILAGDSAGFVDPFTGEGITYAIQSGQAAAETVVEALGTADFSAESLRMYAGMCRKRFGNNLRAALVFARMMNRFPFLRAHFITGRPEIFKKFLLVTQHTWSYMKYVRWLLPRIPGAAVEKLLRVT